MNVYKYSFINRFGNEEITKHYIVANSMDKAVWHIENKLGESNNGKQIYSITFLGKVTVADTVPEVFIPANFTKKPSDIPGFKATSSVEEERCEK